MEHALPTVCDEFASSKRATGVDASTLGEVRRARIADTDTFDEFASSAALVLFPEIEDCFAFQFRSESPPANASNRCHYCERVIGSDALRVVRQTIGNFMYFEETYDGMSGELRRSRLEVILPFKDEWIPLPLCSEAHGWMAGR